MKKAFTLLELLIVILLVAILVGLAIPQYSKFILNARTQEAVVTIQALALAEERYKQEMGEYYKPLVSVDCTNAHKNEDKIADNLKVDLTNSNNFIYWICSESEGNYTIRSYFRKDVKICEVTDSSDTSCKQYGSRNVDSWMSSDSFDNTKGYIEFRYPNVFVNGEYIKDNINYENLFE